MRPASVRETILGYVLLVILVSAVAFGVMAVTPDDEEDLNKTALEHEIAAEINDARGANSYPRLIYNERLADNSRAYSNEMVEHDFYNHTSPVSGGLEKRVACDRAGENLNQVYYKTSMQATEGMVALDSPYQEYGYTGEVELTNQTQVAEFVTASWLASEGHRENIMGDYSIQGIGVAIEDTDAETRIVVTQQFCG